MSQFRIKTTGEHVQVHTFSVDEGTVRFQTDDEREFEAGEVEPVDAEARRAVACAEEVVREDAAELRARATREGTVP